MSLVMMRWCVLVLMGVGLAVQAAGENPAPKGRSSQPVQTSKCNDVPSHPFDLILGRPTSNSVTMTVLCYEDAEGYIAYGTQPGKPAAQTPARPFRKGEPAEIVLSPLQPNTRYFCQLHSAPAGSGEFTFHTARPPGSTFTFTVTADSHLDDRTDAALYQRTLAGALADAPDFHIDLGDTFMTEKHAGREDAARQYLAQRFYFGQLCQSAPLFLVLGNHDGESPRGRGSDADSLAVWSNTMRKRYFPSPVPDSFYAGNATKHPDAGLLQDYYAWEWGDGLFVVLDPFWFTQKQRGQSDNWKRTLGAEQYQWLKRTLEASTAKFKFVFTHHLVGDAEDQCRGGAEAAPFFEWGGKNADGSDGFRQNRSGWPAPSHQLLVQNRVTIVFHGHDHLYAKQDLDGIVYQEVPQPGTQANGRTARNAAEYGYRDGVILGGSGHLRVTVSPNKLTADYVRAGVPTAEDAGGRNRQVAHSYTLASPAVGQEATPPQREERRAQRTGKQGRPKGGAAEHMLPPDVVALKRLSLVLGRPTDKAVTVSVLSVDALEGYCEYGLAPGDYTRKTGVVGFASGKPVDVVLDQLPPDKQCFYRLRYRKPGENAFAEGAEHSFHTQRAPGSAFVFEIQGDSHPERPQMFDAALYAQTLRAAAADRPDFYLTLGDDFSVDTLGAVSADAVAQRYSLQRPFLALIAQSAPLFLVNGNHEQAALCNLDGTPNNVAVRAQTARNRLFPQPAPDGFYTGDAQPVEHIGPLRDYYAWTWGDALFVVIDPYWHSPKPVDNVLGGGEKTRDRWEITLGDEQQKWLKRTLEESKARYKFVFAHHVLGTGRGGIEQADLFEWGGKNKKGVNELAQRRPGWDLPIHPLMAKNGVTIFFQGHDHIFVRQQLDGVVYQTLPLPADPYYTFYNKEAYRTGDAFPGSGRVRVTVSPQKVRVEYVRSCLAKDATPEHPDGEVAFAYELPAPAKANDQRPSRGNGGGAAEGPIVPRTLDQQGVGM